MKLESVSKVFDWNGKPILIIGDSHIPYEHPDYLDFLIAVKRKYLCSRFVHVGDEVDYHAMSFHDSDPDLLSPGKELELALERLERWNNVFPSLVLLESNHGSLVFRRQKAHGLPVRVIKPLQEIYNAPKWSWYHDVLIETNYGKIYGCHGKAASYGAMAKEQGCSAFQGHYHGKFEITWHNRVEHRRFNMFVGCGIDWQSMAFAYGRNNLPKPILGCAVIDKSDLPILEKMVLNEKGRWNGKL